MIHNQEINQEMSDSDSDDEFKELFDAFDQLNEEDTTTATVCNDNNQLHKKTFDPYEPKLSIKEADKKTIVMYGLIKQKSLVMIFHLKVKNLIMKMFVIYLAIIVFILNLIRIHFDLILQNG